MAVEDALDIFGSDPFGRDYLYGLSTGRDGQGLAPYGFRYAESVNQPTTAKGRGYLGNVGTMQDPMTELSASSDFGGRTVRYPLIVPTLTADELNLLRSGGEPTQEIYGKAQQYALGRLSRGQDPFVTTQELRYPQPQGFNPAPRAADRVQESPQSAGLLGGVLPYIYSRADALKRTLGDVVSNPMASTEQVVNNANDRARYLNQLNAQVASQGVKGLMSPQGQELARLYADAYNPVGIFIGSKSKTWNKANADKFLKLEESGVAPVDIWKQTGTFRSPDGKLRQEINDASAVARYDPPSDQIAKELDLTAQLSYGKPYQDLDRATKNKIQKEVNDFQSSLNQNLTHQDLYHAYPELANIESTAKFSNIPRGRFEQTKVSSIGAGNVPVNERIVGERMTSQAPTEEELKSVLLHETQHIIQNRENFAKGGSTEFFKPNDVFSTEALEDAAIIDKLMRGSSLNQLEAKQRFERLFNRSPEAGAFAALERVGTGKTLDAAAVSSRGASDPYKAYRSLAGEVEARAVQSRMNMSPEQRLQAYPIQSYDVPVNQLIYADPFGNPLR
jgi:hypothetical protein